MVNINFLTPAKMGHLMVHSFIRVSLNYTQLSSAHLVTSIQVHTLGVVLETSAVISTLLSNVIVHALLPSNCEVELYVQKSHSVE